MIKSFVDKETEKVYNQIFSKKLPQTIQRIALRKLMMIDNARCLEDLRVPPANHYRLSRRGGNRNAIDLYKDKISDIASHAEAGMETEERVRGHLEIKHRLSSRGGNRNLIV